MGEDKNGKAIPYEQAAPSATYAPWLTDRDFIETYESIKQYTLVDKYRCFELWQLVRESSKLRGELLEVGVWRGGTGALIAKQAELSGIPSTVYLCDTFCGVVKAGENDSRYKGGEHSDTSEELVAALMGELNLKNTKILKGIFPDDTAPLIGGGPFRFCHIDVDVYLSAKEAAEWIWGKLVVGGMLVFDDYGFQSCGGVTKFVNEERGKKGRLVIHNLNGHGIIVKTAEA
jgi:O-methyltransferase